MKKLFIFLCFFCLGGCSFFNSEFYEYKWSHNIDVSSPEQAMYYLYKNISYKDDPKDYWQTPQETFSKGTGDCEDTAILMMQLCHELGYETWLIIYETKYDKRTNEAEDQHAICKVGDRYYDIRTNKKYKHENQIGDYKKTRQIYNYHDALYIASKYHSDEEYIEKYPFGIKCQK